MNSEETREIDVEESTPFGSQKVDALVFRRSSDAPETRAAAAQIHQYRDVAPVPRRFEKLAGLSNQATTSPIAWVPGVDATELERLAEPAQVDNPRSVEFILSVVATAVPIALIAAAVVFVYRWLGFA